MGVYWNKRKLPHSPEPTPIRLGDGLNLALTAFEIKESEASYSRNTSSRNYPALSVCPGRANVFAAITTPNAVGKRMNQYMHVQDGTVWKAWNGSAFANIQTGLASERGRFVDFTTEAKNYTILANGTEKFSFDGTTAAAITDMPATRLICVDDYRIYALLGNKLSCSALGSVTDWTTADDADSIMVASANGSGTAVAAYSDIVICWFEQSMHQLFGDDPYNFQWGPVYDDGCISDYSVIEHRGILYFLDFGAFKVFTGGKPQEVSQRVRPYLEGINLTHKTKCVAGASGKYIYLAIPYGAATENNLILEYDTELGKWYPQTGDVVDFVTIGETLYGITSTGQPIQFNSGTTFSGTAIPWSHITGVYHGGTYTKKCLNELDMVVDLPIGSTMTVSYSTTVDGDDFVLAYTFTASATEQNVRVPLSVENIDFYRIKLAGSGAAIVHFLYKGRERIKVR
jgi:hypothetical protein